MLALENISHTISGGSKKFIKYGKKFSVKKISTLHLKSQFWKKKITILSKINH
jgi:hypothetical protein